MPLKIEDKNKKIKILLVDDDEMVRIYFRDIFWIHGLDHKYELITVDCPEKAEQILFNPNLEPPHIVFTDLVMPIKKDEKTITSPEAGLNLIKKIKSSPALKDIKVIVFSNYPEEKLKKEIKKLGVEDYVPKGENLPKELVEYVEKLL